MKKNTSPSPVRLNKYEKKKKSATKITKKEEPKPMKLSEIGVLGKNAIQNSMG